MRTVLGLGLLMLAWIVVPSAAAANLMNGSFEQSGAEGELGAPAGWETMALGNAPVVRQDGQSPREGRYAVRMSASTPTLAALQQEVTVEADRDYVLQGWVRTENFVADPEANLFGTLMVLPAGEPDATRTVSGPSHQGNTDWTPLRLEFKSPKDGKVLIFCNFCGERTGTGTVWFDALELLPAEDAPPPATATAPAADDTAPVPHETIPTIQVSAERVVADAAGPLLFGVNLPADAGRQIDGLWAQMLHNRSFEVIPALRGPVWDRLTRRPSDDLRKEVWYHSGYEENQWYLAPGNKAARWETVPLAQFRHGLQAAMIDNTAGDTPALLAQDGLELRPGAAYEFEGWIRVEGDPAEIAITVALYAEKEFDEPLAEKTINVTAGGWAKLFAVLENEAHAGRASFAIHLPTGGKVWLDDLSLMPAGHRQGWRTDAVAALKQLRPGLLRFPGDPSASFANWRESVGPRTDRQPRPDVYWGGLDTNDVGTVEFVDLCRLVGAEPMLVVNVLSGSAQDAADWVAYCNTSTDHPMGAWRQVHGRAEPLAVKYWELGEANELRFGAVEYAERCAAFARAMKAVDPEIRIAMSGAGSYADQLPRMLEKAGEVVDLISVRTTDPLELRRLAEVLKNYHGQRDSAPRIRLCHTAWLASRDGVPYTATDATREPTAAERTPQNQYIRWGYALNAARQWLAFQQLGGLIEVAAYDGLANGWGQNLLECPKQMALPSATGRVCALLAQAEAAWPVALHELPSASDLAVYAAWTMNKDKLVICVVNTRRAKLDVPMDCSASGRPFTQAKAVTLSAASLASCNMVGRPETVHELTSEPVLDSSGRVTVAIPAYSVTVLTLW